jgi:hypothetical protein
LALGECDRLTGPAQGTTNLLCYILNVMMINVKNTGQKMLKEDTTSETQAQTGL